MRTIIRAGSVITQNAAGHILRDASIIVDGRHIVSIEPSPSIVPLASDTIVDASSLVAIPGFVQTHIHLCQTLFRGLAEELPLLAWLQEKIFPLEAAHSEQSMFASAMVGAAELIRSGTTTVLDMGSIHHEEAVIDAIGKIGLRASVGKAMMDINDAYPKLRESTASALQSTRALAERWHGTFEGRIRYAAAPRFVLSCTETLLRDLEEMIGSFHGMLLHTHASENRDEVEAVRRRCRMENIEYLNHVGLLSPRSCLAHCIHLSDNEVALLAEHASSVAHCPSSNLKLGSGIADIPRLLGAGVRVTLGADGAACNNSLDMFREMRLASLLQKGMRGPVVMPAGTIFSMATRGGAEALGLEKEIGSLEPGKKADIVLLDLQRLWNPPGASDELYAAIVFSGSPENVHSVMIDGRWIYQSHQFLAVDEALLHTTAQTELKSLLQRL